jgi:hypothetical protein
MQHRIGSCSCRLFYAGTHSASTSTAAACRFRETAKSANETGRLRFGSYRRTPCLAFLAVRSCAIFSRLCILVWDGYFAHKNFSLFFSRLKFAVRNSSRPCGKHSKYWDVFAQVGDQRAERFSGRAEKRDSGDTFTTTARRTRRLRSAHTSSGTNGPQSTVQCPMSNVCQLIFKERAFLRVQDAGCRIRGAGSASGSMTNDQAPMTKHQ